MAESGATDVAATWSGFCDRLKAIGLAGLKKHTDGSDQQAADLLHYMTKLLRNGFDWEIDSQDRLHPRLNWYDRNAAGAAPYGPNLDNSYLLARIDERFTYRLSIDSRVVDEVNISVHTGSPIDGNFAVFGDLKFADFDIDKTGNAEILFSRKKQQRAHFVVPEGADYLFIRFYYFDWEKSSPPAIFLECVDAPPTASPTLAASEFCAGLTKTARWLEATVDFGRMFATGFLAGYKPNELSKPRGVPGGGGHINYGGMHFRITRDEAMLITFTPPKARYWSVQWQKLPWGDPIDVMHHVISLNHTQAEVDEDGQVRMVLSHKDPGIKNWLDTGGSAEGLLMYRWIWSEDAPMPEARVLRFDALNAALSGGRKSFNQQERAKQRVIRRTHLSKRY